MGTQGAEGINGIDQEATSVSGHCDRELLAIDLHPNHALRNSAGLLGPVVRNPQCIKAGEQLDLIIWHEHLIVRVEYHMVTKVVGKNVVNVVQEVPAVKVVRGDPQDQTHDAPPTSA